MEASLLYTCLIILALLVALNLKLTLHLFELIRDPSLLNPPFLARPVGDFMPEIEGKSANNTPVHLAELGQASVLLFLSSRCPQCKEKLAEIQALIPAADDAGLSLLLVTQEPLRHFSKFLQHELLLNQVVKVSSKQYKQLNPSISTPYYLFIDHLNQLQAGGVIGDEDWLSFSEQMSEVEQQEAVA